MKEKDDVKQAFSKNSEAYVTSSTHSKGKDLLQLVDWIEPTADMIILDIATGGGHVAKCLSEHVNTVYATDITKEMLNTASTHLKGYQNIHYVIADAENLPFLDHTFDVVTCRIAAHHFPNPEKFIRETERVLKPGGKFLLIDNVSPEDNAYDTFLNKLEKMRDYSHIRSLKVSEWKQLLHENQLGISHHELKKKTLPFEEWINRMIDSQYEKKAVTNYILSATEQIHTYFKVVNDNKGLHSISIDEWMVLCEKV
ncbi:class I SAM-dependent methyltransferase [Ornithinibacillus salinisoli]|uniref:Class I SAM-dependent methyltransferase n=1 Tax=Ornithinibacillus salinisoli TaxID=1848459 RepID=A0ABW4VXZ2_9BACI